MMFFDKYYLILVLPMVLLSIICQINVTSTFNKYSKVSNARGLTGAEAARSLLRHSGIADVRIERVQGRLTDHYDPRTKVLRLSDSVYSGSSVAAVGVAAHETGHAIQHAQSYGPIALRSFMVPVANIGSMAGPYIALIGLFFNSGIFVMIGLLLFSAAVLFYLVTLPVEFNASGRALEMLEKAGMLSARELDGSRKVLKAAAMTYVASALVAVMSLARLFLLTRNRRRD